MNVPASELERQIVQLEEIKVVIRCPRNQLFPAYNYQRKAAGNTSVTEWLEARIKPLIGTAEVDVIKGDGNAPHGRTLLDTVRESYRD